MDFGGQGTVSTTHGFKYYLCADVSQFGISSLDLCPEFQIFYPAAFPTSPNTHMSKTELFTFLPKPRFSCYFSQLLMPEM